MASSYPIGAWLRYWLNAVDDHSLHSPFLFDFYHSVLKKKEPGPINSIESLRQKLLNDSRALKYEDLGSPHRGSTVAEIAGYGMSTAKYSSLFLRVANFFEARVIVELGTSFGINTLYLASRPEAQVHTFEGVREVADIAEITFEFAQSKNIQLHFGNIDTTLPSFLQGVKRIDMAFIDANHRYEPTIRYFRQLLPRLHERSVVVIDDIHRSPEMEKAWSEMERNELIYTTIDLFHCGLCFFDPSLTRQAVTLEF